MKNKDYNAPKKNLVRNPLLSFEKGRVFHTALVMPSLMMYDVELLVKNGNFNRETFVVAIEKEHATAVILRKKLHKLFGTNFYVHEGQMEKLDLEYVNRISGRKFDFVYLDTCGELRPVLLPFIFNLLNYCNKNTFLGYTASAHGMGTGGFYNVHFKKFFGGDIEKEFCFGQNEQFDRLTKLDNQCMKEIPALDIETSEGVCNRSILNAAILEKLTGGKVNKYYLYKDTPETGPGGYWMTTCSIKLGSKPNADFLNESKNWMTRYKAAIKSWITWRNAS